MDWSMEPGDTAAVPSVRHQILDHLRRCASADSDLSSAELIVGELLANAVSHTDGPASIRLTWEGRHPLLSVADEGSSLAATNGTAGTGRAGPSAPGTVLSRARHVGVGVGVGGGLEHRLTAQLPVDLFAEGGRGLYLVACLALDVAVRPRPCGGTVVEVVLDLTRSD